MRRIQCIQSIALVLLGATLAAVVLSFSTSGSRWSPSALADEKKPAPVYGEEKAISLLAASEFHSQLLEKVLYPIRDKTELQLHVEYEGVLRQEGTHGQRIKGDLGVMRQWSLVGEDFGVCSIQISKTDKDSIAKCQVSEGLLYVSVTFVDGEEEVTPESLDAKRPELGGRSVRQTIKMLEAPAKAVKE